MPPTAAQQSASEPNSAPDEPASSTSTTTGRQSSCPFCNRTFKRSDFTLRHILQVHSNSAPHVCEYCQESFSRADVLKRHMTTCRDGPGRALLQPMKKSCDSCAQLKTVCDRVEPVCTTCKNKNLTCHYSPSVKLVRVKNNDSKQRDGRKKAKNETGRRKRKPPARVQSQPNTVDDDDEEMQDAASATAPSTSTAMPAPTYVPSLPGASLAPELAGPTAVSGVSPRPIPASSYDLSSWPGSSTWSLGGITDEMHSLVNHFYANNAEMGNISAPPEQLYGAPPPVHGRISEPAFASGMLGTSQQALSQGPLPYPSPTSTLAARPQSVSQDSNPYLAQLYASTGMTPFSAPDHTSLSAPIDPSSSVFPSAAPLNLASAPVSADLTHISPSISMSSVLHPASDDDVRSGRSRALSSLAGDTPASQDASRVVSAPVNASNSTSISYPESNVIANMMPGAHMSATTASQNPTDLIPEEFLTSDECRLLSLLYRDDFVDHADSPFSDVLAGTPLDSRSPSAFSDKRQTTISTAHPIWPVQPDARLEAFLQQFTSDAAAAGVTTSALKAAVNAFHRRFLAHYPVIHRPTFELTSCPPVLARCYLAVGLRFDDSKEAQAFSRELLISSGEAMMRAFLDLGPRPTPSDVGLIIAGLLAVKFICFSSLEPQLNTASRLFTGILMAIVQISSFDCAECWPHERRRPSDWRDFAAAEWRRRLLHLVLVEDAAQQIFFGKSFGLQRGLFESLSMPYPSEVWNQPNAEAWASAMDRVRCPPPTLRDALQTLTQTEPSTTPAACNEGMATPFSLWILVHTLLARACNTLRLAHQVIDEAQEGDGPTSDKEHSPGSSTSRPPKANNPTDCAPMQRALRWALIGKLRRLALSLQRWREHWSAGLQSGTDPYAYRHSTRRFTLDAIPFLSLSVVFIRRALPSGGESVEAILEDLDNFVGFRSSPALMIGRNDADGETVASSTAERGTGDDEALWVTSFLQHFRYARAPFNNASRGATPWTGSRSRPPSPGTTQPSDAEGGTNASGSWTAGSSPMSRRRSSTLTSLSMSRQGSLHPIWLIEDLVPDDGENAQDACND